MDIGKECLPDDSMLNDRQVKILAKEAENLWNTYHFYPEFPDNLPARIRYRKMREEWDKEQVYVGAGRIHVELEEFPDMDYDMNGSAKIAIIAIEISIGAFGVFLQHLPKFEDDIFYFIKTLQQIMNKTKLLFPGAESFIRPGFDE
ncbi:MAG: hypothetical protein HY738_00995 [Bacteroidia bacterium]|nr:hypothetical protein [Bacteroidia bacterium]